MSLSVWLAFVAASVIIAATPGPGAVLVLATSLRYNYRTVVHALIGLEIALLIHLMIVAIGLGALLAASDTAFLALKVVGAGYLVWLGFQKWISPVHAIEAERIHLESSSRLFRQGLLVNLTNPKAIIFIVALTPQFINTNAPQVLQYCILGATMVVVDVIIMTLIALLAGRFRRWFHDEKMLSIQNRVFGGLFISAGAALAVSSR
ncbi:LysE family transporter [Nitrincola alkalilacustris]|uniref:LysE family transporter n=1 Tax=Nitrincola alkalilacustris TaxID=1571224 RepID=UPI00124E60D2|nr:LysE family transporter [Nitrincola alkalilacustris]